MSFASTFRKNYIFEGEYRNMSIVVDGIIGAGKTTVARMIADHLDIPMFEELKNDDTENSLEHRMLNRFYADQDRWSAIIQVMFLNERFRDLKCIEASGENAILDRSIYGDEIFAKPLISAAAWLMMNFEFIRNSSTICFSILIHRNF